MADSSYFQSLKQQVKQNSIALLSIMIALLSLANNTWQFEQSEINRNIRTASFETLKALNDLQLVVDYAFYENQQEHGNPIVGWSHVLYIESISPAVSAQSSQQAQSLKQIWQQHWQQISSHQQSVDKITQAIMQVRSSVLDALAKIQMQDE